MSGHDDVDDEGFHGPSAAPSIRTGRLSAAELRGHPLHVDPIVIEVASSGSEAMGTAIDALYGMLLETVGFAPADMLVRAVDDDGWSLRVHGEVVHSSANPGDVADVRDAIERVLHRVFGLDDAAELLAFAQLQAPVAVDAVVPRRLDLVHIHAILRSLLRSRVPIRPVARIIEVLATSEPDAGFEALVNRVRIDRARTICSRFAQADGRLRAVGLTPSAERAIDVLHGTRGGNRDRRRRLLDRLVDDLAKQGLVTALQPVVVCASQATRMAAERAFAEADIDVVVLGDLELEGSDVETVATIGSGIHVAAVQARSSSSRAHETDVVVIN